MSSKGKLFVKQIGVNQDRVSNILSQQWPHLSLKITQLIKASQNYTYKAQDDTGKPYIVRITPDPDAVQSERVSIELDFIKYVNSNQLTVCPAIPTVNNALFWRDEPKNSQNSNAEEPVPVIAVVFTYAPGESLNHLGGFWVNDKAFFECWGNWLGKLHKLSRQFAQEYPAIYNKVREWTELHDSVMAGYPVSPLDQALQSDPQHYGLLHGDVNISNFFYDTKESVLWVFDWDQIERGWFLYDLAQAIFGPFMGTSAGNMGDGKKLECNLKQVTEWMISGYEAGNQNGKVDRSALKRMVELRLGFYEQFCRRAIVEIANDEELKFMFSFCEFVVRWVDSKPQVDLDFI